MQSKESRACEVGGYLGRLRRAMPMQVYIYICWQLELSGNANLRLYQCWFAFTHRSPIKNFASCRLREKILQVCVYAKIWSNYAPDCRYWSIKPHSNIAR